VTTRNKEKCIYFTILIVESLKVSFIPINISIASALADHCKAMFLAGINWEIYFFA
jgi:hypothetical protein